MQQDLFTTLIEQYLAGKASQQEIQLLEEYYIRLGRKDAQTLTGDAAADLQQTILSELQGRMHGSAQTKAKRVYFRQRKWWAVAAMFFLLGGALVLFLKNESNKETNTTRNTAALTHAQPVYHTIQNDTKKVLDTVLPDGTHVWLNKNSSLTYAAPFARNERLVVLTGEAYFEVIHNAAKPFRVKAGTDLIEDLGTKFNVNAFPLNPSVQVTLIEGIVKVNNVQLAPGQQYENGKTTYVDVQAVVKWFRFFKDEVLVFSKFPKESPLSFEYFMTTAGDRKNALYLVGDTALVTYAAQPVEGEYFFNEYSLKNKTLSAHYIQSTAAIKIGTSGIHKNHTLWMYDFASQNLVTDKLRNASENPKPDVKSYPVGEFYHGVAFADGLKIIANGAEDLTHEIQEIDLHSKKLTADYGDIAPAPAHMPYTAWKDAHQSFIYLKPAEDKAVVARRFTDEVKIYDRQTQHSILLKGPEGVPLEFTPVKAAGTNRSVMRRTPKTRIGFQGGAVTGKYIYLLYSGNQDEQRYVPDSKTRGAGKYIYVYDWEGNPVKKFSLDRFVTCFTVSEDNSTIYAVHEVTGPETIYKTKIKL